MADSATVGELLVRIYHEPQGRKQYLVRKMPASPVKKTAAKAKKV